MGKRFSRAPNHTAIVQPPDLLLIETEHVTEDFLGVLPRCGSSSDRDAVDRIEFERGRRCEVTPN